ncbi:MAG TPA: hypothetical protein VLG71_03015 [Candidatus Limnocylindria bacterium]|nr:hypothetical protein [Candidatus Limnocylindria bacterium]
MHLLSPKHKKRVVAGVVAVAAAILPVMAINQKGPVAFCSAVIRGSYVGQDSFGDYNYYRTHISASKRLIAGGLSLISLVSGTYALRPSLITRTFEL